MSEIPLAEPETAMNVPAIDPELQHALEAVLSPDAFAEFAHHSRGVRCAEELAANLEREAVRCIRAGDGFADARRYDLAAGEREKAKLLRRRAAALRVLLLRLERLSARK